MYRSCCISTNNRTSSLTETTLFDTGANPTTFDKRQVAAWIESQQSKRAPGKRKHSSAPTASVALAGTSLTSPIYGSVVFNLTFFNEVTRSNETLYRLHANVIDSCIDIIVGRPVIREHHLVHKLPHYFDETTSSKPDLSQSVTPVTPSLAKASSVCAQPCTTCTPFVMQGYDNTLCSLTMKRPDRPLVPQERDRRPHVDAFANITPIDESTLIERSQLLDAIVDDDDIEWKTDPFAMRPDSSNLETPDEIIAMITFEGSPWLQEQLRSLCREYIDIFSTSVRSLPAQVDPMVIEIDRTKWEVPRNRLPPRHHSAEKQLAIRTQVNKLLELGVIEESQASEWSQVHPVPKSDGSWRLTIDFVQLNAATKGLEGWPIPNILETLTRLGTLKPTCFGLLDFTAGYHQTRLHPDSRELTAFRAAGGLYQWTRVAMGLKGAGPYFQRSMQNKVLNGLVYEICEIYIDDVLIHGKTDEDFLANTRRVFERLRAKKVAVNPRKTKLGLKEVEYVGHLVSATGTSFTPEKRLKVLNFPQPSTQKEMLQFLGLVNYFRDHAPNMTEMAKPLRDMIPQGKYQRTSKLVWTTERSAAFQYCQQAISNCQEFYFLEDTATPILQTDASDYGIGGYLYMVTNGKVRVIRFFSKALVGPQLNWSTTGSTSVTRLSRIYSTIVASS